MNHASLHKWPLGLLLQETNVTKVEAVVLFHRKVARKLHKFSTAVQDCLWSGGAKLEFIKLSEILCSDLSPRGGMPRASSPQHLCLPPHGVPSPASQSLGCLRARCHVE